MSFLRQLFRKKAEPVAEAEYVRVCLAPQFKEERDDRRWDSPGVKEVVTLLNSGKVKER
jgi:hypothetical protein